ncbi:MAG TPA: hypothetical protein VHC41_09605 [Mycobacteriales bacterium]|nr:hypothetical protein [Mycobacteriales bacterium]
MSRHRRALAATSAAFAVTCGLLALRPSPAPVPAATDRGAGQPPVASPAVSTPRPAPGTVLTTIRLADPGAVAAVHVGERINVLAVTAGDGGAYDAGDSPPAAVIGQHLLVASLPAVHSGDDPGGLVEVAATPAVAAALAGAANARLSVTID